MSPIDLFHEARLNEAIAAQESIVADHPGDAAERLFLCDLLAFSGNRGQAQQHLDQILPGQAEIAEYVTEWQDLLRADDLRHAGASAEFLMEPPPHIRHRIQAIQQIRAGVVDALDQMDAADEAAPWVEGHVDGRAFEGWRDADDLLGPILEVFVGSRLIWIPVDQVRRLRFEHAEGLRDHLYWPATVRLIDGREWELFVPSLYVGTSDHPEEGIRTGAGIDWEERNGLMRGFGARTFLFGAEELSVSEFRQVEVRQVYAQ